MGGDPPTVDVNKAVVPLAKLTDVGADFLGWSSDSKTITWAVGSTFLRMPLDKVNFEKPKPEDEKDKAKKEDTGAKPAPKPEPPKPPEPPRAEAVKDKKKDAVGTPSSSDSDSSKDAKPKQPKPEEIAIKLEFPRHRPSGTVVLRGAQVITMRGDDIVSNA